MTAATAFVLLWVILMVSKGTPFGSLLNRAMVEWPASVLSRLQRGHVTLAIIVTLLTIVAVSFQEPDGLRMMGLAIPDFAAWVTTIEVGTYLDVVTSIIAAGLLVRPTSVGKRLTSAFLLRRHRRSRSRPRVHRQKGHKLPANDDEDGVFLAMAI